ncbi:DUF3857 domain-containing transglutaminase family protein [Massilia endophytica]|uniref:DUF3857 domain-containing transglutaminase family protein n=1 Tax=Massilia endophytica TaxID=2899220 RepID=UPI001E5C6919|nr:DUF3857 and transglutaminase domain-containing protein [Massilia endophytica]UGQ48298.1 DUF3857 and transglutaminase domain-containing protein [Massilia endophytica]
MVGRRVMRRLFALLLLAALAPAALATGEGYVRALRERTEIKLNADSTYEETVDYLWRAVDASGASALGQQYLHYSAGRQTFELLEAETIPANGVPVKVAPSDIKTQDGMLGGISFPEKKLVQITFPKLAAGDAIHVRYRIVHHVLDLPGGMSHQSFMRGDVIRDDSQIVVRYPASLALKVAMKDLHLAEDSSADGLRTMRWTYRSKDTVTPEANVANSWQRTPHLMLSTFADWKAIADGYQKNAESKAAVTPEIRALADEVAAGTKDERETARRLYDWVRDNIRYVASYVGDGGWVPNDAIVVLQRRYGDCKDHAALLEAMLAARGIAASPVLLMADRENYKLPEIPVMWFNHAITYIPSLGLYLDSTDTPTPFGLLPENDAGKPVLVTRRFSAVQHTPLPSPDSMRVERKVWLKVALDGSAQRTTEITGFGQSAVAVRQFVNSIGPGGEADWVKRTMAGGGYEGDGDLQLLPAARPDALAIRYVERIRNYVSQPEAGVLSFVPGMGGPVPLNAIVSRFTEPVRLNDTLCEPFTVDDEMEIELPAAMHVLYVPKNLSIRQEGISFDAHYARDGMRYRLTRRVRSDNPRAWCSPQEYLALRPAMNRISKAMNGRLVFVLNETEMAGLPVRTTTP